MWLKKEVRRGLWPEASLPWFSTSHPASRPPSMSVFASSQESCIPAQWATGPEHQCALRTGKGTTLCPRKKETLTGQTETTTYPQTPASTDSEFHLKLGEDCTKVYACIIINRFGGARCKGSKKKSCLWAPPQSFRSLFSVSGVLKSYLLSQTLFWVRRD